MKNLVVVPGPVFFQNPHKLKRKLNLGSLRGVFLNHRVFEVFEFLYPAGHRAESQSTFKY